MMPKSQQIVMNEKMKKPTRPVIKMYKMQGDKLCVDKTIKNKCIHCLTSLLGFMINKQELLAVFCFLCKKIHLLNIETEQMMEAYSGEEVYCMCHGREGRVFVSIWDNDKVMELDCSTSRFTNKNTVHIGLDVCWGLCYLPLPHDCLVLSGHKFNGLGEVKAVSCLDSSVMWRVQGKVEGKNIDPRGLLLFRGSVLVADGWNKRIFVVDPNNGSCIKTIQTPGVGYLWFLSLCDTQIIMVHFADDKCKISFFNVK